MINIKTLSRITIGLCIPYMAYNPAKAITPVLDGYAYQLNSSINIDLTNQIIIFDSNMQNCVQANDDPPLDTALFAISTNFQFIGLKSFTYNTNQDTIYFTSETVDLFCDNGIYVDTLFYGDFE